MARVTVPTARAGTPAMTGICVRFDGTLAGGDVVRTFVDPRAATAVGTRLDMCDFKDAPAWPEPADTLLLFTCGERQPKALPWLERPDHPEAPLTIDLEVNGVRVRWRPGRALLEGAVARVDDVTAALIDFAFYESELRRLESALPPLEASAAGDVQYSYAITATGQPHWPRFKQTVEQLASLRLNFARLEPRLGRASRSLRPDAKRTFARLCSRANVVDRLEAVSDRLEACEDLYEGAVDRITDHRWWQKGHRLEAIIVGLLAMEGLQFAAELLLRLRGR